VAAARARDAAVADLALLRDVAPQLVDVLVIHLRDLVLAEVAALASPAGGPGGGPLARLCLRSHAWPPRTGCRRRSGTTGSRRLRASRPRSGCIPRRCRP